MHKKAESAATLPANIGISKCHPRRIYLYTPKLDKGMHFTHPLPKQLVLTMQASAILLFAVCLQASAATYSQTVSFTGKDVPLKTVFTSLKKQTGYGVFYQSGEAATLEGASVVTLDLKNVALDLFLQVCLRNQPLEYSVEGTTIFIKKKETRSLTVEFAPGTPISEIHGRVTSNKGEPLVNANIIVKRTGHGTIADANGNFTLHNISSDDVITVSFIGYKSQAVSIQNRASLIVLMEPATNDLDQVVVQAYGTTSQRVATGNISTVTAQEIERHPVMNVLEALVGKVPGLEVTPSNGYSSAPFKVEIRGRKYLNGGLAPDPLIIVDGVPITVLNFQNASPNGTMGFAQSGVPNPIGGYSPLFSIDPNEIESVTVLKDADATAIYGSRGGAGVIIITTKKGKAGETKFNVSCSNGFLKNTQWYHLMNTQQYVAMRREALNNDNMTPDISNAIDLVKWDTTRYTDWQRYLFGRTGRTTKVESNVTGGNNSTNYRISLGYDARTHITTVSGGDDRISFSSNLSHNTANNLFKINLTNLYSFTKVNTIDLPSGVVLLPPNAPSVFDSANNLNYPVWDPVGYLLNPFQGLRRLFEEKTNYLNNRLAITFLPVKGLSFKTSFGYSSFNEEDRFVIPIVSQDQRFNPTGSVNDGTTNGSSLIIEPQAEYNYLQKYFKAEILVGSSYTFGTQKSMSIAGTGYTDDNLLGSVANAPIKYGTDAKGQYKYFGIFGRINFNVLDKYIINLTARRDGSSRFGPGKQYGSFWSMAGAWIFSEEKWFKPITKIISFGKIRSSYGTAGSDNVNPYAYLTRWSSDISNINPYGGTIAYTPIQHANPTLQWQENKKLEIAGDLRFLKDRIDIEVVWYRDRCGNQLLDAPLPVMTGFSTVSENLPATVQNSGWEVRYSTAILKNNKTTFSVNFNIGANKNKLLAFPNIENTSYADQYVVGQSLSNKYVFHYTGIDPKTGKYTFEDKDKDGTITQPAGVKNKDSYGIDPIARYFGGVGMDLSVGGLSLDVFFNFARLPYVQRAVYNSGYVPGSLGFSNQSVRALNRWRNPGDLAEFPKYKTSPDLSDQLFIGSDGGFSNGTFLHCKNISLNYALPDKAIKGIKCQTLNIFMKAEHLFTISGYDGLDPTVPSLGGYPQPFTLTFGANLIF